MFLGVGVGAFSAGIYHLVTHAFFKALLFLGAGSVIHALSGEQDLRNMGGLKGRIPITWATMLAGTVAIAGFPPFAGFFSKDEILWRAFSSPRGHWLLWLLGALAAAMTAVQPRTCSSKEIIVVRMSSSFAAFSQRSNDSRATPSRSIYRRTA